MRSGPALVLLRFDPDPRSASGVRAADPDWAGHHAGQRLRDGVTRRLIIAGTTGPALT